MGEPHHDQAILVGEKPVDAFRPFDNGDGIRGEEELFDPEGEGEDESWIDFKDRVNVRFEDWGVVDFDTTGLGDYLAGSADMTLDNNLIRLTYTEYEPDDPISGILNTSPVY